MDLAAGRFEPVVFCPGYLRGCVMVGDFAIIGLSLPCDRVMRRTEERLQDILDSIEAIDRYASQGLDSLEWRGDYGKIIMLKAVEAIVEPDGTIRALEPLLVEVVATSAKQKPSFEFLQQRREEILMLAARHGAKNVRVFGSVARGEADEDSDIDFLIDYDLDKISPWFPAGLLLDLEGLLGFKVDVATIDMLKVRIKDQVLREAIVL